MYYLLQYLIQLSDGTVLPDVAERSHVLRAQALLDLFDEVCLGGQGVASHDECFRLLRRQCLQDVLVY